MDIGACTNASFLMCDDGRHFRYRPDRAGRLAVMLACTLSVSLSGCALDEAAPTGEEATAEVATAAVSADPDELNADELDADELVKEGDVTVAWAPPGCDIWRGPHRGQRICNTDWIDIFQHPNGLWETFVVGTDFAIWHSWETAIDVWTPWQSLGGTVQCWNGAPCRAWDGVRLVGQQPTIQVRGTDGRNWCRTWPWTQGWRLCGTSATYESARSYGFGGAPAFSRRDVVNTGAITGDDGILSMRWFIPAQTAAGGLLLGDNRGFNYLPSAAEKSRATLTWNTATGQVSLTILSSTLISGQQITALPLSRKSSCASVTSSDLARRSTNDYFVGAEAGGLRVCLSLLNSLTNSIDVASWSVDLSGTILPANPSPAGAGGYKFNFLGNGYPAIEATYYPQGEESAHLLFQRRVDPGVPLNVDAGGGMAALDLASWFRCVNDATGQRSSVCFWDSSMVNPSRQNDFYFTDWTF
jgi:hypothetical protein